MRRYPAVSGHFSLPSLLEITVPSAIATVLREPRARLVSLYTYWRTPHIFDPWLPYTLEQVVLAPLGEFLANPLLAPAVDNQICRMLLHGDQRIPTEGFIAQTDMHAIAEAAAERLQGLGFTGVLELGDSAWQGMGQFFGAALHPRRLNAAGDHGAPTPADTAHAEVVDAEELQLLEQRSTADRIVYEQALELAGVGPLDRSRIADVALASGLDRLEDLLRAPHEALAPAAY
ncbi:MAG TPA: hypothetical protein VMS02_07630 [Solirubrobacteraceae bacterium]|nr:hypothetical protein [Solirubrobacteraceae bacterium]